MNIVLPADATSDAAASWLRQLVRDFGLGFHPDTAPEDYIFLLSGENCFTSSQCDALSGSLDCLFEILGDERPYEIGAGESSAMLAESLGLKPPLEYNDPEFQQQLLCNGSLHEVMAWLSWNDPNGIYTDQDSLAEDRTPLTLHQARQILQQQITGFARVNV